MPTRFFWVLAILLFCSSQSLFGQTQNLAFSEAWQLTEDETGLQDWQEYQGPSLPLGFNKIVWLRQTLPTIETYDQGLFFANGLEDLEVFIDGVLIYSYGDFSKKWSAGSSQRWHFIPLNPAHSGKELRFRTHSMISYMTRTLYPTIRKGTDVYASQWRDSLSYTMVSGAFGVLAIICLAIAAQRRKMDVFLYFGLMTLCSALWTMFNQDSLVKQFTSAPESSWIILDLVGLFIAVPALFAFFANVLNDNSRVVYIATKSLWILAALAALCHVFSLLNPWYILPIMHLVAMPALVTILPRMVLSSFRQNKEARYLILGSVAVSISGLHDAARYVIHSPLVQMIPIGISIMFGSMVAVLAQRYRSEQNQTIVTQAKLLDDIQSLNAKLQDHVHKVEAIVEEKTIEIRSILGHIQQGIFMVEGRELRLNREYSAYLEHLLGETAIGGHAFRDSFLDKCQFGADQKQTILSILELVLGEDRAGFDLNAANLPQEAFIQSGNVTRILELSWAPILDETGHVQKILVTARDVTRLRELQKEAQRSQEEVQLVQIILAKKPERFARFIKSSRNLLEQVEPSVAQIESASPQERKVILRNLHTLKGNARSFSLDQLADLAHQAEQDILTQGGTSLRSIHRVMKNLLGQFSFVLQQRMGWTREADHIMIDRRQIEQYFLQDAPPFELENFILPQVFVSAQRILTDIFTGVQRIAEDLGKEKPDLDLDAEGFYFPRATEEVLVHCFGHLFRNALDHGLETADERLALGKKPSGCISIQMHSQHGRLVIRCSDDGRGLDIAAIHTKALARGIINAEEPLNEARIEELIFSSGFSTKSQTSLVSGRGVGLDAVRGFLRDIHAHIRLLVHKKDVEHQLWHIAFELSLPAGTFLERSLHSQAHQAS